MGHKPYEPYPDDAPQANERYQHYKGDFYEVVGHTFNSETDEWMVKYKPLYESPYEEFSLRLSRWKEEVDQEGKKAPRYSKV